MTRKTDRDASEAASRPTVRTTPTRCAALAAVLVAFSIGCGERTTNEEADRLSRSLSDVMIAVQTGADSTARLHIADSVARAHGFDDWADLREALGDVAVEPERLRTVLDSTQKQIQDSTR